MLKIAEKIKRNYTRLNLMCVVPTRQAALKQDRKGARTPEVWPKKYRVLQDRQEMGLSIFESSEDPESAFVCGLQAENSLGIRPH